MSYFVLMSYKMFPMNVVAEVMDLRVKKMIPRYFFIGVSFPGDSCCVKKTDDMMWTN